MRWNGKAHGHGVDELEHVLLVMAYIVMAYIIMPYIVMAQKKREGARPCSRRAGTRSRAAPPENKNTRKYVQLCAHARSVCGGVCVCVCVCACACASACACACVPGGLGELLWRDMTRGWGGVFAAEEPVSGFCGRKPMGGRSQPLIAQHAPTT